MTGDDRFFEPGSIQWDADVLPIPLRWAPEDFGGHDGAVHVAWIESITREGNSIMGEGNVFRQEFMDYLDAAGKAGVSVDCDSGTYTVELVEPEGLSIEAVDTPEPGVEYGVPRMIERYQDARLRAATVVDIPAFITAYVTPDGKPMVASGFSGFIEVAEALFDEATLEGRIEETGNLRDDGAIEYSLDGATLADQIQFELARTDLVAPPTDEVGAPEGVTHAGLALQALDTGRVLMVQRAIDAADDPAAGKWEFPGGGIDPGEDPLAAAQREFAEEVGHPLSDAVQVLAEKTQANGIYAMHLATVPTEADQENDGRSVQNPDGHKEATAWWALEDIPDNPMVRQEVLDNFDQMEFQMTTTVEAAAAPPFPPKAKAPAAPPADKTDPAAPGDGPDEAAAAQDIQKAIDALGDANPEAVAHLQKALDGLTPDATAEDHLTASAAPVAPPDEWFEPFALDGLTPLTVTASGRVFGHYAPKEGCHVGPQYAGKCVKPPSDPKAPYFHLGQIITASGETLDVGSITVGGGHFTASGVITSLEHHDDQNAVVAAVVATEDEWGYSVFGSIVSDATPAKIAALRRAPVSGAWTTVKGRRRLKGIHAVVDPGFPMPRAMVASVTPDEFITFGRVEGRAPDPSSVNLRAVAQRLARSVGLDTESLVASARVRMSQMDCGCDDSEED